MGWSISVPCKSLKARDQMLEFLGQHFRGSAVVLSYPKEHWQHQYPKTPGNSFAYGHSDSKIGFDSPNEYEIAVLRWVATKIGMKRKFKARGINFPVPWLNCDGSLSEPIVPQAQWDSSAETQGYVVNEFGWRGVDRWWEDPNSRDRHALVDRLVGFFYSAAGDLLSAGADKRDSIIRAEISRLDDLWSKEPRDKKPPTNP